MAIIEVKVPQLSESVAEATLLQWKKKVGDAVAVDEILIDVETDKVVMEVPAPAAGVIVEITEANGSTVAAEQLLARIDTEAVVGAAARGTDYFGHGRRGCTRSCRSRTGSSRQRHHGRCGHASGCQDHGGQPACRGLGRW